MRVWWSPADVADWPITRRVTSLAMAPDLGVQFGFDQELPDVWKWPSNPNNPEENYQYTAWFVPLIRGQLHGAGFVQLWQGRPSTGGFEWPAEAPQPGRPTFHDYFHVGLAYAARWGDLNQYFPNPGEPMGLFVTAGNGRGANLGVTSVRERSNAVVVSLPQGDTGSWAF
jgi:hypothetical protein